jgi:hypothetical protein
MRLTLVRLWVYGHLAKFNLQDYLIYGQTLPLVFKFLMKALHGLHHQVCLKLSILLSLVVAVVVITVAVVVRVVSELAQAQLLCQEQHTQLVLVLVAPVLLGVVVQLVATHRLLEGHHYRFNLQVLFHRAVVAVVVIFQHQLVVMVDLGEVQQEILHWGLVVDREMYHQHHQVKEIMVVMVQAQHGLVVPAVVALEPPEVLVLELDHQAMKGVELVE